MRTLNNATVTRLRRLVEKEYPGGLCIDELEGAYKGLFGARLDDLNPRHYGHESLESLLEAYPGVVNLQHCQGTIIVLSVNTLLPQREASLWLASVAKVGEQYLRVDVGSLLRCGGYAEVRLGQVYTPHRFWLLHQGNTTSHALDSLMECMFEFYSSHLGGRYKVHQDSLDIGAPVVAFCSSNMNYKRALVTSLENLGTVKLFSVDYGTVWHCDVASLHLLHKNFFTLPAQAIKAALSDIKTSDGRPLWSWQASRRFREMVQNRDLVAEILCVENAVQIKLWDTNGKKYISIGRQLIEEGWATSMVTGSMESQNEIRADSVSSTYASPQNPTVIVDESWESSYRHDSEAQNVHGPYSEITRESENIFASQNNTSPLEATNFPMQVSHTHNSNSTCVSKSILDWKSKDSLISSPKVDATLFENIENCGTTSEFAHTSLNSSIYSIFSEVFLATLGKLKNSHLIYRPHHLPSLAVSYNSDELIKPVMVSLGQPAEYCASTDRRHLPNSNFKETPASLETGHDAQKSSEGVSTCLRSNGRPESGVDKRGVLGPPPGFASLPEHSSARPPPPGFKPLLAPVWPNCQCRYEGKSNEAEVVNQRVSVELESGFHKMGAPGPPSNSVLSQPSSPKPPPPGFEPLPTPHTSCNTFPIFGPLANNTFNSSCMKAVSQQERDVSSPTGVTQVWPQVISSPDSEMNMSDHITTVSDAEDLFFSDGYRSDENLECEIPAPPLECVVMPRQLCGDLKLHVVEAGMPYILRSEIYQLCGQSEEVQTYLHRAELNIPTIIINKYDDVDLYLQLLKYDCLSVYDETGKLLPHLVLYSLASLPTILCAVGKIDEELVAAVKTLVEQYRQAGNDFKKMDSITQEENRPVTPAQPPPSGRVEETVCPVVMSPTIYDMEDTYRRGSNNSLIRNLDQKDTLNEDGRKSTESQCQHYLSVSYNSDLDTVYDPDFYDYYPLKSESKKSEYQVSSDYCHSHLPPPVTLKLEPNQSDHDERYSTCTDDTDFEFDYETPKIDTSVKEAKLEPDNHLLDSIKNRYKLNTKSCDLHGLDTDGVPQKVHAEFCIAETEHNSEEETNLTVAELKAGAEPLAMLVDNGEQYVAEKDILPLSSVDLFSTTNTSTANTAKCGMDVICCSSSTSHTSTRRQKTLRRPFGNTFTLQQKPNYVNFRKSDQRKFEEKCFTLVPSISICCSDHVANAEGKLVKLSEDNNAHDDEQISEHSSTDKTSGSLKSGKQNIIPALNIPAKLVVREMASDSSATVQEHAKLTSSNRHEYCDVKILPENLATGTCSSGTKAKSNENQLCKPVLSQASSATHASIIHEEKDKPQVVDMEKLEKEAQAAMLRLRRRIEKNERQGAVKDITSKDNKLPDQLVREASYTSHLTFNSSNLKQENGNGSTSSTCVRKMRNSTKYHKHVRDSTQYVAFTHTTTTITTPTQSFAHSRTGETLHHESGVQGRYSGRQISEHSSTDKTSGSLKPGKQNIIPALNIPAKLVVREMASDSSATVQEHAKLTSSNRHEYCDVKILPENLATGTCSSGTKAKSNENQLCMPVLSQASSANHASIIHEEKDKPQVVDMDKLEKETQAAMLRLRRRIEKNERQGAVKDITSKDNKLPDQLVREASYTSHLTFNSSNLKQENGNGSTSSTC